MKEPYNKISNPAMSAPADTSGNVQTGVGGKESNQVKIPEITLPKGGGAIKSIDEKFSVNAANGTAGFDIPFPFSPSRNSFMPSISLSYNSGSGNGAYGLGWNAAPSSITRKTEKKLPEYDDGNESDTFIFSGSEDLVPALKQGAGGTWVNESGPGGSKLYRPGIEGGFARIEKLTEANGNVYWKVTSKENIVSVFGKSKSAQVFNPADETKIFKWLLEFSYDDKGSCLQLVYKKEDKINVPDALFEKHRLNDLSPGTNAYLKRIKYCNKTPFPNTAADAADWDNLLNGIEYLLELIVDYGEHDAANPQPGDDNGWPCRQDAFSDYRAGFDIRTYRLCSRILMFHHFPAELKEPSYLVRSMDLQYDNGTAFSFLRSISQTGYVRATTSTYSTRSLPPVEFTYEPLGWNTEVRSLPKDSLQNLPVGIDDRSYQWIDLYSEGISGILTEQANTWYYKSNLGNGDFDPMKPVASKPSLSGLGSGALHFQDIEGNGKKSLVSDDLDGYYEFTQEDEWMPFKNFKAIPNIDVRDPNLKFIDLDGDGRADILISEDNVFIWYASKGKRGFDDYRAVRKTKISGKGPDIVFADSTNSIVIADMSGDGLMDIVRIRNGEIVYWPNLGYGKFGARINMSNAPVFDQPDHFNSAYLKLADIDGSGTTDIVYLAKDSFKIYFNQSGNSWSEENIVPGVNPLPFSKIDDHSNVNIIDLLGNGTGCIVWSSPLPKHAGNPLRYINLMAPQDELGPKPGNKPHVMTGYKNNLGNEVAIEYKPSTYFYLEDKKANTPWVTRLPFPVQCVSRTTTKDKWRQTQFSTQYTYHHGYYDYSEREFRGFGRVDQVDAETFGTFANANSNSPYITSDSLLYQPPVMTKTWFYTGAFLEREKMFYRFAHEYFLPVSPSFSENVLPGPDLDALNLTVDEYKQALRSCKGMTLRQEVYELDVEELEHKNIKPVKLFSTAFHNCHIRLLQPKSKNEYAVFLTTESEAITYNYELDLTGTSILPDPRIAHTLNLQTDEFGNVLRSIAAVYPRIGKYIDATLPTGAEELIAGVQQALHLSYTINTFTNDVINDSDYRLRLPCQVQLYELTGLTPSAGFYFTLKELRDITGTVINEIPYHLLPDTVSLQKRMVECVRILYFAGDLKTPEIYGTVNALALPYETYQLALTEDLLNAVIGEKLSSLQNAGETFGDMLGRILPAGGYHNENSTEEPFRDKTWWIRSGIAGFADDAASHFYLPEKYTDPFGNATTLTFDKDYHLYMKSSDDAVGNHAEISQFNFRVLAPSQMQDINKNISAILFDITGMPAAMALKGKGDEADNLDNVTPQIDEDTLIRFFTGDAYDELQAQILLGNATARYVYYSGEETAADGTIIYGKHPACAAAIAREQHVAWLTAGQVSPVQVSFQYSDGSGTVIASKVQAEPESGGGSLRWITNGKTILNNKGNPVKQYEPYFTTSHFFEEPEAVGVTPVMYYDAAGRLVRTEMPDGSYSRVEFTPWFSATYDQNDTVLEDGNAWYRNNTNTSDPAIPLASQAQQIAAALASVHANTPAQTFSDSLGRPVISIAHNKWKRGDPVVGDTRFEEKYLSYTRLDAEGKPLWISDARGNRVMQYIFPFKPDGVDETMWNANYSPCYDIAGNLLFQHSMDAGDRWMIADTAGKTFYSWDVNELQQPDNSFVTEQRQFVATYDGLQRPTGFSVIINGITAVIDKTIYGESAPDAETLNLRGNVYQHFDSGGMVANNRFDFKGNLLETQRQLAADYKATVIDWKDDTGSGRLEAEIFSQQTEYDALNRMTRLYNWHKSDENVTVYQPQYSRRGLLQSEDIIVKTNKTETGYSGGQLTSAVSNIIYDAKGQLQRIYYGNGTAMRYSYDEKTFRLLQLRTTRKDFDPVFPNAQGLKDAAILQNLYYTYDAVGNITEIYDDAYDTAFFNNQVVEPRNAYKYDALYQLIEATGRENTGLTDAPGQQNDDTTVASFPVTTQVLRNYTQQYDYDAAGNILKMKHWAGNGALTNRWTRVYIYDNNTNRLLQTYTGDGSIDTTTYTYDTHGSVRNLINTDASGYMRWDYKDMIRSLDCVGGGWAYYQYDAGKERNRKTIERLDGSIEDRQYFGGTEWYRRKNKNGDLLEEIETHHLFAAGQRVLIAEDVISTDNTLLKAEALYRYQYNNHLGSACLELDENAAIVSYEEYHPYGTSSYKSIDKSINPVAKRYRYTGMERDEESGLEYHSARYYMPWLGRWASADPIGVKGGVNIFGYSKNNPTNNTDRVGKQPDINEINRKIDTSIPYTAGYGDGIIDFNELTAGLKNSNYTVWQWAILNNGHSNYQFTHGVSQIIKQINEAQGANNAVNDRIASSPDTLMMGNPVEPGDATVYPNGGSDTVKRAILHPSTKIGKDLLAFTKESIKAIFPEEFMLASSITHSIQGDVKGAMMDLGEFGIGKVFGAAAEEAEGKVSPPRKFPNRGDGLKDVFEIRDNMQGISDDIKVAAKVNINGQDFVGLNQKWANAFKGLSDHWGHAEVDALNNAFRELGTDTVGQEAEMWVTEDLCTACITKNANGNVRKAFDQMGLNELIIHTPTETLVLTPYSMYEY